MNAIKILFEDDDVLVLDKPSGITVNRSDTTKGEETVQDWVEDKFRIQSLGLTKSLIFIKEPA